MAKNLTLTSSAFTASSGAGFGQSLTGGYGQGPANLLPSTSVTVSAFVKSGAPGRIRIFLAQVSAFWLGCDASGNAIAHWGSTNEQAINSAVNICDGARHHVEFSFGTFGAQLFVDGVSVGTSAVSAATAVVNIAAGSPFDVRSFQGSGDSTYIWLGEIDEPVVWTGRLHSTTFTAPTTPLIGNETGLFALWHLDGVGTEANASAVGTHLPNSLGIFYSPYNWLTVPGSSKSINAGAYFKTLFSGASCTLNFDTTNLTSPFPRIQIRVDGRTVQNATVAATVSATIPADGSATTHLLEVIFDASTETVNRWNAPQNTAVVLQGLTLASSSETLSLPKIKPFNTLIYGDSISEGVRTIALNGTADLDRNSASICWPLRLGDLIGCEVGVVGFGATGINTVGNGNVPALPSSYAYLWSGQARDFSTLPPKYCLWLEGTNDGSSDTRTNGIAALNAMLTAMPATTFILLRPLNGTLQEFNLKQIAQNCSDPSRVSYISTAGFWSASDSSDSLHPFGYADIAYIAPSIAAAIQVVFPALSPIYCANIGGLGITGGGQLVSIL